MTRPIRPYVRDGRLALKAAGTLPMASMRSSRAHQRRWRKPDSWREAMSSAGVINDLQDRASGRVGLDRVVELSQRHLGVDAVFITELAGGGEICRAAAGDAASFDIVVNHRTARQTTYSRRLLAGEIPSVVPDAGADRRVAELAADTPIGCFIGVPLHLSDGTLYGALCGLSHSPAPGLDERDVRFMSTLGELVVEDLDERRRQEQLRSDLLGLIEGQEVEVAYQPIIDLRSHECLGLEALARFPEPYTRPDRTLAAAQSFGLRVELERLAVSEAWRIIPLLGRRQFLALNLAPDALVELARRANVRDDVPLSQVVVEVTEHSVVDCYEVLHRELEPLRKRGLRIAVDDAGAGYASLRHVLELRPDFIKVDRSLIHGIADDRARRVAVGAFMSLARDLGSMVIGEGVERQADLSAVRALGLHAVQGFLLGRPTTNRERLARFLAPKGSRQADPSARKRSALLRRRRPVNV
jgi:EAL domain-containing protein (putative c-di-GMP-specific phosphodiesterase class I)